MMAMLNTRTKSITTTSMKNRYFLRFPNHLTNPSKMANMTAQTTRVGTIRSVSNSSSKYAISKPNSKIPSNTQRCDFDRVMLRQYSTLSRGINGNHLVLHNLIKPRGRSIKNDVGSTSCSIDLSASTNIIKEKRLGRMRWVRNISQNSTGSNNITASSESRAIVTGEGGPVASTAVAMVAESGGSDANNSIPPPSVRQLVMHAVRSAIPMIGTSHIFGVQRMLWNNTFYPGCTKYII